MNDRRMEDKPGSAYLQRDMGCNELLVILGCEVAGTCYDNCRKSAAGEIKKNRKYKKNSNMMQFDSLPGKETIDALLILRRIHKDYQDKVK